MKALILAAGLGTRLRPWTLTHPKALVPVGGVPMLERVIRRLAGFGFTEVVVNTHHFSDQIKDFVSSNDFGVNIRISDETDELLDTGGGLLRAMERYGDGEPWLIHNVDILSDAPLDRILAEHIECDMDITLLTSGRESSRKLIFAPDSRLVGWHNLKTDEFRPVGFNSLPEYHESAFSGIYIVNGQVESDLRAYTERIGKVSFPVMDFFLDNPENKKIGEIKLRKLNLIDIGKPDTLKRAEELFG